MLGQLAEAWRLPSLNYAGGMISPLTRSIRVLEASAFEAMDDEGLVMESYAEKGPILNIALENR